MATFEEMAAKLREANPENNPMSLTFMAKVFWPDADWINLKCRNGGARRGAVAAGGMAGRMARKGLLTRHAEIDLIGPVMWQWKNPT